MLVYTNLIKTNENNYHNQIITYNGRKRDDEMPLTMVRTGEPTTICKIGGKEETKRFLENLGFVAGGKVTVVSEIGGNMIVNVKDSRVAIGKEMANKILVQ